MRKGVRKPPPIISSTGSDATLTENDVVNLGHHRLAVSACVRVSVYACVKQREEP